MLILGIDDAGRGPLIGPMILSGVLIEKSQESKIKKIGVKDSKLIYHSTRIKMAKQIKEIAKTKVISASPDDIDQSLSSGINLNTLEAIKTAQVINSLNNIKKQITVVVDCPSTNTIAWRKTLMKYVEHPGNLNIKCEHKADFNHPIVSAASILAKVKREEEVEKLKKQYGDFGSGYPSDPKTKDFLKEHGKKLSNSGLFRKSWSTWKKMFPDKKQQKLF